MVAKFRVEFDDTDAGPMSPGTIVRGFDTYEEAHAFWRTFDGEKYPRHAVLYEMLGELNPHRPYVLREPTHEGDDMPNLLERLPDGREIRENIPPQD